MFTVVNKLVHIVEGHRIKVYIGAALVLLFSFTGIVQMQTTGNIVDDIPDRDRVIQDLHWVEAEFGGPCRLKSWWIRAGPGCHQQQFAQALDRLQNVLDEYPEFSRSVSAADATKFAFQAFKNGHPKDYRLPRTGMEKTQFGPWLRGSADAAQGSAMAEGVTGNFFDSTRAVTRVSVQMADVGTLEMRELLDEVRPRVDSIFPQRNTASL